MNVPDELAEYKLERAELAIALPPDWKLDEESMTDERWYWPVRLLKVLARLPITSNTWLGWGHTMDNQKSSQKTPGFAPRFWLGCKAPQITSISVSFLTVRKSTSTRLFLCIGMSWSTNWSMTRTH